MMKFALSLLAAAIVGVAGCNTMEGAGKDIQRAGEKLEGAAKKK